MKTALATLLAGAVLTGIALAGEIGKSPLSLDPPLTTSAPIEEAAGFHPVPPPPFGIGANYFYQEQDYRLTKLDAVLPEIEIPEIPELPPIPPLPPPEILAMLPPEQQAALLAGQQQAAAAAAEIEKARAAIAEIPMIDLSLDSVERIRNRVHTITLKPDWWILPFLNLHGIFGYVDGRVDVELADPLPDVQSDYNGWVYGGGATAAVGLGHFFTSVTVDYTKADIDPGDSSIGTWVVLPKIGLQCERGAIYTGAHYQKTKQTQDGVFNFPSIGEVPYSVEFEDARNWNYVAGGRLRLTRNLFLTAEGGFGNKRYHGLVSATFRF